MLENRGGGSVKVGEVLRNGATGHIMKSEPLLEGAKADMGDGLIGKRTGCWKAIPDAVFPFCLAYDLSLPLPHVLPM